MFGFVLNSPSFPLAHSLKIGAIALVLLRAASVSFAQPTDSTAAANFGFENQSANWAGVDGKFWKIADDGHGGVKALQYILYKGSKPTGDAGRAVWNDEKIPVTPGESLELSAFVKGYGKVGFWRQGAQVRFFAADGKLISQMATPGKTALHYYDETRLKLTVPAQAAYAQVGAIVWVDKSPDEHAYLRFDDFSLMPSEQADALRAARIDALKKSYFDAPVPQAVAYDAEDSGPVSQGSLSVGKFYRFSRKPDVMYPDSWPSKWTDGSRLTDEDVSKAGDPFRKDDYVGWRGKAPIDIVIDLGRVQTVVQASVHGLASAEAYFLAPSAVAVYTRVDDKADWQRFGEAGSPPVQDQVRYPYTIAVQPEKPVSARYVKVHVVPDPETPPAAFLLLDSIDIVGDIKSSWRKVPSNGAFHGAFPTAVGHTAEERQGRSGMVVDLFEKTVGKKLSMVLWYQAMEPGRGFSEIQSLRKNLTNDFYGHRHLVIGWLPKVKLDGVAQGEFDDYFETYFSDSVDPEILQGIDDPIWFRPMNEFNAGWIPYGLEPKTFRQAWRRMYNIAEQTGAAQKHIFVWSPNHRSYPDEPWNKMEEYWPGDQYVDWTGISAYPPSMKFITDPNRQYPIVNIQESYEKFAKNKPFMITEGGFSDDIDRVRWVREWFTGMKEQRPNLKALIWENHGQRVISRSPEALELYRELVQDPYWISETWDGTVPDTGSDAKPQPSVSDAK